MPSLTYEKNAFVISGCTPQPISYWTPCGNRAFKTQTLKAAYAYREFSDGYARRAFSKILNGSTPFDVAALKDFPFLDRHQVQGILWAMTRKRSYLAHAAGAGKTVQAILAAYLTKEEGKTIFIVPPSLTVNWRREIEKFSQYFDPFYFPTISIVPTSSHRDRVNWEADFIICPDSMLSVDWVYENLKHLKRKFLGVDEASRFKEAMTKRSQALYSLVRDCARVVFLDGSPMPNRPMELWAPAFMLDPEAIDCKDSVEFGMRYCGATLNQFGGWEFKHSSNEAELREKLQARLMHVVLESELRHPERRRSLLFLPLDLRSPQQKAWERRHLGTLRLSEIDEEASQGDIAKYRAEIGVRKAPEVARHVKERLNERSESILLFAWHREVCEILAERLREFSPAIIYGGTGSREREKAMSDFQAGKTRLLILNIASAGRGHNLQKADRVIFAEYSWSDELNRQCEKRASRKGRDAEMPVRCEYLVSPGSIDEIVLQSIFTKESRVKRILG